MKTSGPSSSRRFWVKKTFLFVHRWFGFTAGAYFVLLGLSGSYIVYSDTFQGWIAPKLRASSAPTDQVSLASVVTAAQQGLMTTAEPLRVALPEDSKQNARVTFNLPTSEEKRRFVTAFIDPANLEYKGSESFKETVSGKIFVFHHDLFLGSLGRTIMGVCGILMLAILITGVYLILPKKNNWILLFKARPMRTLFMFSHETHRLIGLYSLVLMILVTFSGVYISKPDWFGGGNNSNRDRGRMTEKADEKPEVMDYAKVADEFKFLRRPIELRIDAKKKSIRVEGREESKEPKTFAQNQRAIHGGHFWGALGHFLIFISGLLPLYFYVTGFIIWRKKYAN